MEAKSALYVLGVNVRVLIGALGKRLLHDWWIDYGLLRDWWIGYQMKN